MDDSELRLLELIAARMCHDLVGPVGASVNGAELLAEGEAADAEVVRLIGQSARQASRRLQVFRVAYGTPGALSGGRPFAQAGQLLAAMLEGEKASVDWQIDAALDAACGRAGARLALLVALIGVEALARGGVLRVSGAVSGPRATIEAVAAGPNAKFPDETAAAARARAARSNDRKSGASRACAAFIDRGGRRFGDDRNAGRPGFACQDRGRAFILI